MCVAIDKKGSYCDVCWQTLIGDQTDYRFNLPVCLSCGAEYDKLANDLAEQESQCAHCQPVTVTYGGLKNAQNEAFQEGIAFALKKIAAYQGAELDGRKYELYDEPACTCGGRPQ